MRGLVVALDVSYEQETHTTVVAPGSHDSLLRPYLLYWDRLEYPQNGSIYSAPTPDQQLLIDEEVLTRTEFPREGWFMGEAIDIFIKSQFDAFLELEKRQPGCWAVAQETPGLFVPEALEAPKSRQLIVELTNVLPVPSYDIPLDKILRFKQDRQDELATLQAHLDELYQKIASSHDVPRAKAGAIEGIERALIDLTRVSKESFRTRILNKMSVSLSPVGLASGVVAAATAGATFGLTTAASAGVGAAILALSTISFSLAKGPKLDLSSSTKPFAYVHSVVRTFGL